MDRIIFCVFLGGDLDVFNHLLPIYFPSSDKHDTERESSGHPSSDKHNTEHEISGHPSSDKHDTEHESSGHPASDKHDTEHESSGHPSADKHDTEHESSSQQGDREEEKDIDEKDALQTAGERETIEKHNKEEEREGVFDLQAKNYIYRRFYYAIKFYLRNVTFILGDSGADNRSGRKIKRAKSVRVKSESFTRTNFSHFIFLPLQLSASGFPRSECVTFCVKGCELQLKRTKENEIFAVIQSTLSKTDTIGTGTNCPS